MAKVSLSDFSRELAVRLPQNPCRCRDEKDDEEHFTFSAENLPAPPPLLATSDLVMAKTEHHYGNCCRIDAVHFYGTGQTHRELGVLILAALFSDRTRRVAIDLEHTASTIRRLEINSDWLKGECVLGLHEEASEVHVPSRNPRPRSLQWALGREGYADV